MEKTDCGVVSYETSSGLLLYTQGLKRGGIRVARRGEPALLKSCDCLFELLSSNAVRDGHVEASAVKSLLHVADHPS